MKKDLDYHKFIARTGLVWSSLADKPMSEKEYNARLKKINKAKTIKELYK
jgi:hypothetical protein